MPDPRVTERRRARAGGGTGGVRMGWGVGVASGQTSPTREKWRQKRRRHLDIEAKVYSKELR